MLLAVLILGRTLGVSAPPVGGLDPAVFSPGACVAYAPIRGDRHLTVFLDAGHGGIDPGQSVPPHRVRPSTRRTRRCRSSSTPPRSYAASGFRVVVSRTRDRHRRAAPTRRRRGPRVCTVQGVHDDVAARDVCANDAHANVLVGIYFDAGARRLTRAASPATTPFGRFAADNLRLANLCNATCWRR